MKGLKLNRFSFNFVNGWTHRYALEPSIDLECVSKELQIMLTRNLEFASEQRDALLPLPITPLEQPVESITFEYHEIQFMF